MPKYMDYHRTLPPADIVEKVASAIRQGRPNEFGMRPINVFAGKREVWCLTEAPNAEAVLKSHESLGVKIGAGDVSEVSTLV
ncbi:MAG: DUF4242 domain-containing protein [Chloroflexi bacterium]|nr:DUF4242 domain-containing protein [Chloroflexota bacterium]